jgi:hypothetical protein
VPWWIQGTARELHHGFTTQGQPWRPGSSLSHLLGNSRTCGGRRLPPGASPSSRQLSDEWMDRSPLLGRPRDCIYALRDPWGVLHLALHDIFLGREGNLVSVKSASSKLSYFVALPCQCYISHFRTPNNANSVRLYGTKFPPTLVFTSFLGNEDKISKSGLEDNLFWFRTNCATGISGVISPSSLTRIGPSTYPNQRYRRAHNFSSQTFSIRGHLGPWICTERSCCLGQREYLSGWVDLVGKPPSP